MKISEISAAKLVLKDNPLITLLACVLFVTVGVLLKTNPNLFLQTPPPIFSTFLMIAGSAGILLFYSYSIIIFDKRKNTLSITRYGLLGFGTKMYRIDKITKVHYRLDCYGNAASRSGQIELHIGDETIVPLTIYRSSDNLGKDRELGEIISKFLGVQYIQDQIKDIRDGESIFYD